MFTHSVKNDTFALLCTQLITILINALYIRQKLFATKTNWEKQQSIPLNFNEGEAIIEKTCKKKTKMENIWASGKDS